VFGGDLVFSELHHENKRLYDSGASWMGRDAYELQVQYCLEALKVKMEADSRVAIDW
jgi:hypothetical protein